MRKYLLHILVIIMTISLIGIIVVQISWISNAIQVKEAEYEENIREALENIVKKIERKRAVIFISENLDNITVQRTGSSAIINKQHLPLPANHYTIMNLLRSRQLLQVKTLHLQL